MNETPAVSIILCVYNGRNYLENIVGYVEGQSFDDYEMVFVVDSRCNDGSQEFIADYCGKNERASYIVQTERTKLGGAKNMGLDAAKGKYIWFLDIDDKPSDDFLRRMVDAKESTGSDVALCNFQYTDDKMWTSPGGGEVLVMSGKKALHARSLNIIPVTSWAMLYDREHIFRNGFRFREMMAEDVAFTYLALSESEKVCYITAPLYGYYQNEGSYCKKNKDERGRSELETYMYLSEMFPKENRYLQNRFCLIAMRSLTHMTSKGFREVARSDVLRDYAKANLTFMGRVEYYFIRFFPRTYHCGVNWYINNFYCRTGKIYTDKGKMKTIRAIVNSSEE